MLIREIEEKDNTVIEAIIRKCLIEFNANHDGTAWSDPNLGNFSNIYNDELNKYWVCVNESDEVIAGVGIGYLLDDTCELQKMYCLEEYRGSGSAHLLIRTALEYAKKYYKRCYLETLSNMTRAISFYEKYGFKRIDRPIIDTGHFSCDVLYIKDL